ncbi:MAG TPA: acyl-CoA dehydrogenase family protein [Steroidobacteraceae bacterium]|jgi:acyl-CoA dehydrogenase|nr:acyl-CoA dehydrogenase family protein [Steroidobacteraceae bacterium]
MNLDFSPEQQRMRDAARRFLAERCTPAAVRKVFEGEESYDKGLWRELAELGYLGIAIPEEFGGSGGGYLELCVIAEELGRVLAPVPVASSTYLAAEFLKVGGSPAQQAAYLPKLASGALIGTFAMAEAAGEPVAGTLRARVDGGRLTGTKTAVADGDTADFAIVAAGGAGAPAASLYIVDLHGAGVARRPLATIDPSRSFAELTFRAAPAEPLGVGGDGERVLARVLDGAAVLMAFEQLGGADFALEAACAYAKERWAFGRPIGSNQAIKHMLADMYVSATLARSNCYYGAWALSTGAEALGEAAASARISATQAFQHCARNNIQVHGGSGFTWAVDCHLYYRRSNLLALALGGLAPWEDRLVDTLRRRSAATEH